MTAPGFDEDPRLVSPGQVEAAIQEAVSICWTRLPREHRNTERLIQEFTRLRNRVLTNVRDDAATFEYK